MTSRIDASRNQHAIPELCERIHQDRPVEPVIGGSMDDEKSASPFDVLWTRKRVADSPLAEHVASVRRALPAARGPATWSYDPESARRILRDDPGGLGVGIEPWNRACSEMTEHACALLTEVSQRRSGAGGARIWPMPVEIGDDSAGAILAQAREGANCGRTTKSNVGFCTHPLWAAVMREFGLAGVASFPPVAMGSWWMAHIANDYPDWRQDYLSMLDYTFYYEYNIDKARFDTRQDTQIARDLNCLLDMPGLCDELRARRLHMTSSMAFFDTKRQHEVAVRNMSTDGLTAWVHRDRDWWRDFKAMDSGAFPHYLSFAQGDIGRDDMMLTGLTNDWVDLGPDLRNDECNQSVLAMTRGSVTTPALLQAYERSVWMMNAQFTSDCEVKRQRYTGCMGTIGTCMWEICSHRHDLWRYFMIGVDASAEARQRDLYKAGQLADCYSEDFEPSDPVNAVSVTVPRRPLSYEVVVDGERHAGEVELHNIICEAIESFVLPRSIVTYSYVVPMLLHARKIAPSAFLSYMDDAYCENFATVMRSGQACGFSDLYCRALASLVMEQWWFGMYFAIGIGSLIEAQPGKVANDRAY